LMIRTKTPGIAQSVVATRFQRHVVEDILPQENPASRYASGLKAQQIRLRPASSGLATEGRRYEDALLVLMGIVGIVLLIACAPMI